jgi:hypothetical protein
MAVRFSGPLGADSVRLRTDGDPIERLIAERKSSRLTIGVGIEPTCRPWKAFLRMVQRKYGNAAHLGDGSGNRERGESGGDSQTGRLPLAVECELGNESSKDAVRRLHRAKAFRPLAKPRQSRDCYACNRDSSPTIGDDAIIWVVRYRNLLALLALLVWLYASVLTRLFLQWVHDPNFSHSIFVPIFALFVIWQDRKKLEAIPSSPSWAGLPLVVLSMLVLVLGILGADIFLPRVSLLILLAGLIILFQGWTFFRAVLFPWAFLILMIPIPALISRQRRIADETRRCHTPAPSVRPSAGVLSALPSIGIRISSAIFQSATHSARRERRRHDLPQEHNGRTCRCVFGPALRRSSARWAA